MAADADLTAVCWIAITQYFMKIQHSSALRCNQVECIPNLMIILFHEFCENVKHDVMTMLAAGKLSICQRWELMTFTPQMVSG